MNRKINFINNVIYLGLTMLALFGVLMVCNDRYSVNAVTVILYFVVGAIVAGLINTFAHELGHLMVGKKNGFVFSSMSVWFFKWSKRKNKIHFDFCMIGDEAGYTEMIPTSKDNLDIRLKKMTRGGVICSFVMMLIGIPPLLISSLPSFVFCVWSAFLPIGIYFFLGTALPMYNEGLPNDGAVLWGIKKGDDAIKVNLSLLAIQAEMYNGKLPSEVDEKLYFDLPQLPEDDPAFAMLLNARYCYYLDKEDYDHAKKTNERLTSIIDYLPKSYRVVLQTELLYSACAFDYNEDLADDLTDELSRYLNNVNNSLTVRAKLAYILNVKKEKEAFDIFYKKGIKEADRCQIKGLGAFERKLLDRLKLNI